MGSDQQELVVLFVAEATEGLADIENDLLAMEAAGARQDANLVNKVFRSVHSIKGTCGFLGFRTIGKLAHEMETILNLVRNQQLVPRHDVIEALLHAADLLRSMILDVNNSEAVDITQQVHALTAAVQGTPEADPGREIDIPLADGGLAFVMVPERDLLSRQRQGCYIYVASIDLFKDVHARGLTPLDMLRLVFAQAELIDSYVSTAGMPSLDAPIGEELPLVLLLGSKLDSGALAAHLNLSATQITLIAGPQQTDWTARATAPIGTDSAGPERLAASENRASAEAAPIIAERLAPIQPEAEIHEVAPPPPSAAKEPPPATSAPRNAAATIRVEPSLRVNVKVLDTLMNLAGELVLGRNQLLQVSSAYESHGLKSVAARLDQVTSELQEAIMQTRMQPISTVFSKFPRLIRDLSNSLSKECELAMEGEEVELDKSIIESIGDPLTHLVRNSVDHGLEMPAERAAQGKPRAGKLILRAFHQAGKVHVQVIDDGAGINLEKVKEKAVAQGVITKEQAHTLSEREAARLIFHPGLSTAKKVTDVSGRGVGMDVVKTNIEKLGGTVEVDTRPNAGTTVHIKLPLTLAIIPSLVVRCGNERFAIPQVNISELVRIKAEESATRIEHVKEAEVLRLRGTLLPLLRLNQVLGAVRVQDTDETRKVEAINVIVVETGHLRYGLIVDGLHDSQEIVVKPLGRHMKSCNCLAGATILGDGRVALIVDVAGIAASAKLAAPDTEAHHQTAEQRQQGGKESHSMLIFTNAPGEQFAIPMALISRIERIRNSQIDSVGGREVLQYRGTSLALLSLDKLIRAETREERPSLYVVVFKAGMCEAGLIAPELVDIREITADVDTVTFREPGVLGSMVVDGKTTRFLDLSELAMAACPEWFAQHAEGPPVIQSSTGGKTTLLVAEDSDFFRKMVVEILVSEGYEVVGCEDGQIAWNTLQDPERHFDAVVTDIEMPNMNGYELCSKIKHDPCFAHLPVVAVTSLAGEEDMRRGKEAGVDEYQVKLDREGLKEAVSRLLKLARERAGTAAKRESLNAAGASRTGVAQ